MSVERDIRFDLIARLCPNTTGAELRSVATEVSFQIHPHFLLFTLDSRLECLLSVLDGKWLQNATFSTLWRKLLDRAPSSLARKSLVISLWTSIERFSLCFLGRYTKCTIRSLVYHYLTFVICSRSKSQVV